MLNYIAKYCQTYKEVRNTFFKWSWLDSLNDFLSDKQVFGKLSGITHLGGCVSSLEG